MRMVSNSECVSTHALYVTEPYLAHHGIKGMKWGVRRYQNEDGSLTSAGARRYNVNKVARVQRDIDSFKGYENGIRSRSGKLLLSANDVKNQVHALEKTRNKLKAKGDARKARDNAKIARQNSPEYKKKQERAKKAAKIGLAVAGTALAAYGGYKLYTHAKDKKTAAAAADMSRKMQKGEREFSMLMSAFKENVGSAGGVSARSDYRMPDGSVRTMMYDKATGSVGWRVTSLPKRRS